jgi:hypothetical protein
MNLIDKLQIAILKRQPVDLNCVRSELKIEVRLFNTMLETREDLKDIINMIKAHNEYLTIKDIFLNK